MSKQDYGVQDIKLLKYPFNVREKIGMYLGSSDINGFNHTFTEILDNSIDEFVAGNGEKIDIAVDTFNNIVSIRDYGRGIPFGIGAEGKDALTLALTSLHAGGKHKSKDGDVSSYKFSSGVHGVGASVVQAASDFLNVTVWRDGKTATQKFENGFAVTEVEVSEGQNEETGTFLSFKPSVKISDFDKEGVFESGSKFTEEWIVNKLKYIPFINNGLTINLKINDKEVTFKSEEKISNLLNLSESKDFILNEHFEKTDDLIIMLWENDRKKVLNADDYEKLKNKDCYEQKNSRMRLAFDFSIGKKNLQMYFVNGVLVKGGKQETSFRTQLKKAVNDFILEYNKKIGSVELEDILDNMSFVYSVQLNDPSFSGQTKESLNNPEVPPLATYFFKETIMEQLLSLNPEERNKFFKIIEANKKARISSDKIKENTFNDVLSNNEDELVQSLGKLKNCFSRDPFKKELFLIEGDSAAGSLSQSRSVEFQALLPLRGKPLNTLKDANKKKILKNKEIASLINALGVGFGENFNYDNLKYHKIVILADADVDGKHIQALLLTFFYSFYPELIKRGNVYIAVPPLYKVKKGKELKWVWSKAELNNLRKEEFITKQTLITRFKGLGEMSPEELFDSTLDPRFRKFIQVSIEDFNVSEEQLEVFMGDEAKSKDELKKIMKNYYIDNIAEKQILQLEQPFEEKEI